MTEHMPSEPSTSLAAVAGVVTEVEARALLRACDGPDGLEAWIARQRWQPAPGGWTVRGKLAGWRFRLEAVAEGGARHRGPTGRGCAVWVVRGR